MNESLTLDTNNTNKNSLSGLTDLEIARGIINGARQAAYEIIEDYLPGQPQDPSKVIQREGYRECLGEDVHVVTSKRRQDIARITFSIAFRQARLLEGGKDGEVYKIIKQNQLEEFISIGLLERPELLRPKPINNDHEDDGA